MITTIEYVRGIGKIYVCDSDSDDYCLNRERVTIRGTSEMLEEEEPAKTCRKPNRTRRLRVPGAKFGLITRTTPAGSDNRISIQILPNS